jgi:hypothetical protein
MDHRGEKGLVRRPSKQVWHDEDDGSPHCKTRRTPPFDSSNFEVSLQLQYNHIPTHGSFNPTRLQRLMWHSLYKPGV